MKTCNKNDFVILLYILLATQQLKYYFCVFQETFWKLGKESQGIFYDRR